jgi:hypothetical protein
MSLVAGRGPLSPDPAGRFSASLPDDLVYVEPHPRRVQAIRDGRMVIDTERAVLVHRRNRPLSYAFPADEVDGLPNEPEPEAPGYVVVPWEAVDTWLEEGAHSCTTRRIRTTAWTAGRRSAGCGSTSPVRRWWTPTTR